jgi:ATP-binding cassette subfamily G (WHITE) protein 2 (SNQ2)
VLVETNTPFSGYVQQTDTHLPQATVREALLFSAKLRQPSHVPLSEKEEYVDKVLDMCGLRDHADAIVGTLGVEMRKRTTIGVELAAKPKLLLFLDEPTSGLDSQSAWAIMGFLRSLAVHGQAILCTIHQPSAELFQVFNRVLILRKGGQTVYFGDIGLSSSTLIGYFERNGARKCNSHENPFVIPHLVLYALYSHLNLQG